MTLRKTLMSQEPKVDHHPINSRNYAAAYYQTLEGVRGPLLPEKNAFKKGLNS